MMSPPSCATAGRTRVSSSSLIWDTTSSSSSWDASTTALSAASTSTTGRPAVKCSMITARTTGFSWYQSLSASFVTVTKSAPRKTPVTCGREKSRSASGDTRTASSASVKFAVPEAMTVRPGRNFRVAGYGVCSVWMNIDGSECVTRLCTLAWGLNPANQPSTGRQSLRWGVDENQMQSERQAGSADGVELLPGQAARDDCDWNTQAGGGLAGQVGDQRPGSFRSGSSSEHEYRYTRLLGDQGEQLVATVSLTDIDDRYRAGDRGDLLAEALHQLFGFLAAFLAGEILDRNPMLQFRRLDHIKKRDPAAGMCGAARGVVQRCLKLFGLVNHHEKNARVCGPFHWAIPLPDPHTDQALLNGRLANHPATIAVSTAIAP